MRNRLADAASPYLLQHKDNPVHWQEWGPEAFGEARRRNVPVLLSVGYSACHWCHVMAHESFEDEATADYMNRHFVNVKVDREERPDVDRIYMDATQAMTGHGGWPMTVFLDADGRPFFAGTYYPKTPRGHFPSFMQVMESVVDAWATRREDLAAQATRLTQAVSAGLPTTERPPAVEEVLDTGVARILGSVDQEQGGFGGAPKFPQAPNLELLLRYVALVPEGVHSDRARRALSLTLDHMAAGGIYDHLGGGFARYAVDRTWLVPHFEKMLYDNALLSRIYLRAWQVLGHTRYRQVATETLDYLLNDMADPSGALHSAEDADSEGVEGKYYTWPHAEFSHIVGPDAEVVASVYGVTPEGNFEGTNVLHRPTSLQAVADHHGATTAGVAESLRKANRALLAARSKRIRPGRDDKIVAAWNGLALRTLAEAGAILDHSAYLDAAVAIADFAATGLRRGDGRLLRSTRAGTPGPTGFCDDYAALGVGYLTLYQATGDPRWFDEAERLIIEMRNLFADPQGEGFFATGHDAEPLITRPKNLMDNPTPSDNALAAEALQMYAALTGDADAHTEIEGIGRAAGRLLAQYPAAVGHLMAVLAGDPLHEIAVVGSDPDRRLLANVVWSSFRPNCVIALGDGETATTPLLDGRAAGTSAAAAFVCRNFVCQMPVNDPTALEQRLAAKPPGD